MNFNLGSLEDWQAVLPGEVIDFDLPDAGFRQVQFDVLSEKRVSVYAATEDGVTNLVVVGEGQFSSAASAPLVSKKPRPFRACSSRA